MTTYAIRQEASLRDIGEAMGLSFERVRQIERETMPEELVVERRARDDRRIEREVDAMVREIRATAQAHRFIERVVCGMEEGGHVSVLEERAGEGA